MIIRFFRGIVHDGQQDAFQRFFEETGLPLVRSQDGLISASIGLPHVASPREFSMITVWRDLDALKGFAGEDWQTAFIHPDEAHLLAETHVHHYSSEA